MTVKKKNQSDEKAGLDLTAAERSKASKTIFQFKITLKEAKPQIWRRI